MVISNYITKKKLRTVLGKASTPRPLPPPEIRVSVMVTTVDYAYVIPGTVQSIRHIFIHLIFFIALYRGYYYYLHFVHLRPRDSVPCLRFSERQYIMVVTGAHSGDKLPGPSLEVVWPWTNYLTSLGLSPPHPPVCSQSIPHLPHDFWELHFSHWVPS